MKKVTKYIGILLISCIIFFLLIGVPKQNEELYELDKQVKLTKPMMVKCLNSVKESTEINNFDEIMTNILDPINNPSDSINIDDKLLVLKSVKNLYLEKKC